ncbi:MAG: SRPBCC family protein [Ignavibacteria bacterium]|nr:SRPBCC family protein [Ignavibacteria bacterium]
MVTAQRKRFSVLKDIFIPASPETVWISLTTVDKWPEWISDVTAANSIEGMVPGGRFTFKKRGIIFQGEVLQSLEREYLELLLESKFGNYLLRWQLKSVHNGVHIILEADAYGLVPLFLRNTINKFARRFLLSWLIQLKRYVYKEQSEEEAEFI